MPRPKNVYRQTDPVAVDHQLFDRLEHAGGISLDEFHRKSLVCAFDDYNSLPAKQRAYRRANGIKRPRGRPSPANLHAFVFGLLLVYQKAGGSIRVYRPRPTKDRPREEWNRVVGRPTGNAADFLRIAWEAIENPEIAQDGFARLVLRAWRDPRNKARKARDAYIERTRNAWRGI